MPVQRLGEFLEVRAGFSHALAEDPLGGSGEFLGLAKISLYSFIHVFLEETFSRMAF